MQDPLSIKHIRLLAIMLGSRFMLVVLCLCWLVVLVLEIQNARRTWISHPAELYLVTVGHYSRANHATLELTYRYDFQGKTFTQKTEAPFQGDALLQDFDEVERRLGLPDLGYSNNRVFVPPLPLTIELDPDHPEVTRINLPASGKWVLLKLFSLLWVVSVAVNLLLSKTLFGFKTAAAKRTHR